MQMTLDEFRQLSPEDQQQTLADLRRRKEDRIREAVDLAIDRYQWHSKLVPTIAFQPTPRQTLNLDPPPMSDEEVREKFRRDPNLKELITGGIRYARI